jgi:hypothetical protein
MRVLARARAPCPPCIPSIKPAAASAVSAPSSLKQHTSSAGRPRAPFWLRWALQTANCEPGTTCSHGNEGAAWRGAPRGPPTSAPTASAQLPKETPVGLAAVCSAAPLADRLLNELMSPARRPPGGGPSYCDRLPLATTLHQFQFHGPGSRSLAPRLRARAEKMHEEMQAHTLRGGPPLAPPAPGAGGRTYRETSPCGVGAGRGSDSPQSVSLLPRRARRPQPKPKRRPRRWRLGAARGSHGCPTAPLSFAFWAATRLGGLDLTQSLFFV